MSNSNGAAPETSNTALTQTVTAKVVYYEVMHQMDGRLRLRVPRLANDAKFAQRVLESATTLPAVQQARVNARSSSLVVTYRSGTSYISGNGRGPVNQESMLSLVVECLRVAAGADVAQNAQEMAQPGQAAINGHVAANGYAPARKGEVQTSTGLPIGPAGGKEPVNYAKRLGLPALGLGLSAGVLAGLSIPGVLVGGAILYAALPIFKRTVQGIRDEKKLTVDFLDSLTIVLMTAQASFLAPAFIVAVIEGSEIVRDWTASRSKEASLALVLSQEHQVLVERDGVEMKLSWEQIEVGDIIHVYPGDQIPVDGTVLTGSGLIDQHHMTGDATAAARHEGDDVHAGTFVTDGYLRIVATSTGHDTLAATLTAMAAEDPDTDTRVSNWARKTGNWAVVPTLAAGAAVFAGSGSIARATAIVSLDLGTGMRVSAPIAVVTAQTNAAKNGILIRSGRALETLAEIDTIIFDKTATLTQGRAEVVDVQAVRRGVKPETVVRLAASAEHELNHPLAKAVARYAQERGIDAQPSTSWSYVIGKGVVAEIDGKSVHVGSRRLMEEADIAVDQASRIMPDAASDATTHVYVALDGKLMGVIFCADPVRAQSAEVVASLLDKNIPSLMLTGDSKRAAHATAAHLGMDASHVFAAVLPEEKADLVQKFIAGGRKVAVVGDGVNDAAAFASADLSISLGGATDLARETADVVLLNNDLRDLVTAIEIAQQAMAIIRQNRTLVVGPNISAIVYGLFAVMSPTVGVVINNGTALLAALNSLRPLNGPGSATPQNTSNPETTTHHTKPMVIDA
ncbi:MAG: heavy metal translocating P-type ATPase [Anaerolineae bacterium]